MPQSRQIILCTLNARYIHASLGLRYLYANLDELQPQTMLLEFTIKQSTQAIADEILKYSPKVVGFGVYIWNTRQTERVVRLLKRARPDLVIVIGGPEVSYEFEQQVLYRLADHLITGQADVSFRKLCDQVLAGHRSIAKLIRPLPFNLHDLNMPYRFYSQDDVANRVIYVEASRGCPFKCEFCLSSLDKTAYPFDTGIFLSEMDRLHQSGARNFKFVDRTFNLKLSTSTKILDFFLERMCDDLFLHFELIPDHLPEPLKSRIVRFPPGQLQFEIGIQTFTPAVQSLISRRQNNEKAKQNLTWLKRHTRAHLHTDLIFGLPGETIESFASSFNQLVDIGPDEIQLGLLKRLRGTPIGRHTTTQLMEFDDTAPYEIISTGLMDHNTVAQVRRFSKFWDKVANSGRFKNSLPVILNDDPFHNFLNLSDDLFDRFQRTHSIHVDELFSAIASRYSSDTALLLQLGLDKKRFQENTRHSCIRTHNRRQMQHLPPEAIA